MLRHVAHLVTIDFNDGWLADIRLRRASEMVALRGARFGNLLPTE